MVSCLAGAMRALENTRLTVAFPFTDEKRYIAAEWALAEASVK